MAKKNQQQVMFEEPLRVSEEFAEKHQVVLLQGNSAETLKTLPDSCVQLIITSPPYNVGKQYERATDLAE